MTIYALIDPRTSRIRYIGKTANLADRMRRHLLDGRKRVNRHCSCWISGLLKSGLEPRAVVLELCEGDGCEEERFHIRFARNDGIRLVNMTEGGEGILGYRHSAATRLKLREQRVGKKQTKEEVERRVAPLRGRKQSPELVERRVRSHRGRKMHPNSRAALDARGPWIHTEQWCQDHARKLTSNWRKRVSDLKPTMEARGLVTVAEAAAIHGVGRSTIQFWIKMGWIAADRIGPYLVLQGSDVRAFQRRSMKGRPVCAETRAKMSVAAKRRWNRTLSF